MPIFTGFGVPDDQRTGSQPVAGLTTNKSVNSFWGTTTEGGAHSEGAVFQLTRDGTEGLVYSFCSRRNPTTSACLDGQGANAVTVGPDLELYGTTSFGGNFDGGIVYRVTIGGNFTVLHEFCKPPLCADGSHPFGRLIFDAQGALYGMTNSCGDPSSKVCQGTAFRMTPPPEGKSDWGFAIIHHFCGSRTSNTGPCPDGQNPIGGLVLDPSTGDLYGATSSGGKFGFGVVFKLKPRRGFPDDYLPDVLHSFAPVNTGHPSLPEGDLAFDTQAGVLYGAAVGGNQCPGVFSCGVIYKIAIPQ
jgi:uncharacterized repeat protein (TIGR03803 family)